MGAGAAQGAVDASNMLKPKLARGELRAIGATTLDEYRKYIEKDAALERRFQPVLVGEPSVEETIAILRGLKERYELHHGVTIKDAALIEAATLSHRYITDRFLPDKAIDLVDEAASRLRIEMDSVPAEIDEIQRRLIQVQIEIEALKKERDPGAVERRKKLEKEAADLKKEVEEKRGHWTKERELITAIRDIKEKIDKARTEGDEAERKGDFGKVAEIRYGRIVSFEKELSEKEKELGRLQAGKKMLKEEVDEEDIAEIVSKWTGIPVSRMLEGERQKMIQMEDRLHQRVVDQEEAIAAVSNTVRRARAGLQDPNRPLGSFLFMGPTGVGKTELAKALAEFLFDDEQAIIRIDMSEFQERHTVSRLIGAPPGYVGYEEGGYLTEAVRRRPYSIVLLDEVEKAHQDVFNVLLQVLDDGRLTDGQGRTVDFKNSVIVMTSNIGSQFITGEAAAGNYDLLKDRVMEAVRGQFKPEFINRIDEQIIFKPLTREDLKKIVDLQLKHLSKRTAEQGITLEFTERLKETLAREGYDPVYGARPLKRLIQRKVQDELAMQILKGKWPMATRLRSTRTPRATRSLRRKARNAGRQPSKGYTTDERWRGFSYSRYRSYDHPCGGCLCPFDEEGQADAFVEARLDGGKIDGLYDRNGRTEEYRVGVQIRAEGVYGKVVDPHGADALFDQVMGARRRQIDMVLNEAFDRPKGGVARLEEYDLPGLNGFSRDIGDLDRLCACHVNNPGRPREAVEGNAVYRDAARNAVERGVDVSACVGTHAYAGQGNGVPVCDIPFALYRDRPVSGIEDHTGTNRHRDVDPSASRLFLPSGCALILHMSIIARFQIQPIVVHQRHPAADSRILLTPRGAYLIYRAYRLVGYGLGLKKDPPFFSCPFHRRLLSCPLKGKK